MWFQPKFGANIQTTVIRMCYHKIQQYYDQNLWKLFLYCKFIFSAAFCQCLWAGCPILPSVFLLKFYSSDAFSQHPNVFKPESTFNQTPVDFFYLENMTSYLTYITATLRALFAGCGYTVSVLILAGFIF